MKRRDFVPWKPSSKSQLFSDRDPLLRLQNEMNKVFDGFFSGLPFEIEKSGMFTPRIDVKETEAALTVRAELPGLSQDDIEVTLNRDNLVLKGEKRLEDSHEEEGSVYYESSYGKFQRTIPFHCEIAPDDIECTMTNGVLSIRIPKAAESQKESRKVKIKVEK